MKKTLSLVSDDTPYHGLVGAKEPYFFVTVTDCFGL